MDCSLVNHRHSVRAMDIYRNNTASTNSGSKSFSRNDIQLAFWRCRAILSALMSWEPLFLYCDSNIYKCVHLHISSAEMNKIARNSDGTDS